MYNNHQNIVLNPARGAFFKSEPINEDNHFDDSKALAKKHKSKVILDLTITPQTFLLLEGSIHFFNPNPEPDESPLRRVQSFGEFGNPEIPQDEVLIALDGLLHKDLSNLGIRMGFRDDNGYLFRTYEKWSAALDIRTRTTDEQSAWVEGTSSSPQMRS